MARAKSALKSAPKKKRAVRSPKFVDTKYLGFEPEWDGAEDWSDDEVSRHKRDGLNWYNYFHTPAELKGKLYDWMKEAGYSAAEIKAVKANPDNKLTNAVVANATMLLNGMPNTESAWLRDKIVAMIEFGKNKVTEKKKEDNKKAKSYVPTIQERMREQLSDFIGEFDEWEDNVCEDAKYKAPGMLAWLKTKNVAQAHIAKIIAYYEPRLAEMKELQGKDVDPDLKEGYSHLTKTDVKRIIAFYEDMIADLNSYHKFKQVNRKTRTKKAPTTAKLVSKLKYKKEDNDLKLVSIKPSDIIGATVLWVYNCKTRKLGIYKADPGASQLSVKGTTILGFDEKASIAKTVRKPEEKLKEFNKAGKVKLRTFLDDIKAVDIKLTGRINADTILLKAY